MSSILTPQRLPRIDLVYTKTEAGRQEVLQRGAGLNARQRAALIMLDGQRAGTALAALMPSDQIVSVLAALVDLGLIDALEVDAPDLVPAAAAFAPALPPTPDPAALAAIKTELIVAAETYLGLMAADVVGRVRKTRDAEQLARVLGQWHMAMQASKHGRDVAEAVLEKARAVLHGTAG